MNNRPINTVPVMVRRPLFWALLISLVLHMPVLAIVAKDGWFAPDQPEPAQLQMTLLAAVELAPAAGVEAAPAPPPASLTAVEPVPASSLPAPVRFPDTVIRPAPAETIVAVNQPQIVQISAARLPALQGAANPAPDPAPEPRSSPEPAPPPIQMAADEVAAMHEVVGRLLQHLNSASACRSARCGIMPNSLTAGTLR